MAARTGTATTTVRSGHGNDERLYVRGSDGRRIGWYDLSTGTTQLVDPDPGAAAEVQAAVDAYVAAASPLRRRPSPGSPLSMLPAPRTAPTDRHAVSETRSAVSENRNEDLRDRFPGEHVTGLLLAGAAARASAPAGGGRSAARDPLGPGLRHLHQAALGQQQVGAALAGLPRTWHVMHCVPTSDRSCLDHLLLGPGGVVVLRTAAHPDRALRVTDDIVRPDGRPVSHVRLLRRQVGIVADRLQGPDLPVRLLGVVVVIGTRPVRTGDLPAGVSIVGLGDLARWVADLPTVLSQIDVARLASSAARPGTWPTQTDVPTGSRQQQRGRDRAALVRLTAHARHAARWRRARRAGGVGAACAAAASLLLALRPELVPAAVAALTGG